MCTMLPSGGESQEHNFIDIKHVIVHNFAHWEHFMQVFEINQDDYQVQCASV